ncbi:hypothetical protein [Dyadobacter sp. CY312]|uniref:hypothetical protein n=1 Tax=Dyadobacter sp. CY312 TaxID=2907303 RepID=UPI001F36AEC9|nr:hypothetical protein [Dyadobacter sp. CY312]MCE7042861.1 hypothetical protein [Dyadobacter sp. CY312]
MKPFRNTLISAVTATSTMTLFSYIVSKKEGENFKEPKLLGDFVKKSFNTSEKASKSLGWGLHFLTGVGFAGAYKVLLSLGKKRSTVKNGLLYGLLAGGAGVVTWSLLFKNHHNPPKTHRTGFYTQLVIAHVIFGLTLSAFKGEKKSRKISKSI